MELRTLWGIDIIEEMKDLQKRLDNQSNLSKEEKVIYDMAVDNMYSFLRLALSTSEPGDLVINISGESGTEIEIDTLKDYLEGEEVSW